MTDILMMILVGLAGLLALVLGVLFCPFGVFFWLVLAKNTEDAVGEAEQGLAWWRRRELGGLNPFYSPSRHLRAIASDALEQGIKDSGLRGRAD